MNKKRPSIPRKTQSLLWLRAGGRCEFRGCNQILYEDNISKDPINAANIAHIISWTDTGPRGNEFESPKLATDISNLMLMCPTHNHLIDSEDGIRLYTVACLREMKQEHEDLIRELTELRNQSPKRIIELKSLIQGQRPFITEKDEAEALFPFFPERDRVVIDICDISDFKTAKAIIDSKVKERIVHANRDESYAAFIMASIPYSCYLGYVIGNKIPIKTFQYFRDTEDWKWRTEGEDYCIVLPEKEGACTDVNLFVNVSGIIDRKLVDNSFPVYSINAKIPGVSFLQSWEQVISFRNCYRIVLDQMRKDYGESVKIHLYQATPNPISFEIGRGIMKNLDPTIIIYDKTSEAFEYKRIMCLHERKRILE